VNTDELKEGAAGLCVATLCADPETVEAVKQAVVRKNAIFAGELQDYLRYESDPLLLQKLQRAEVSVCVIDFDRDRTLAVEASDSMQQTLHGRTTLIAVSAETNPNLILEAMRAGCSEYLTKPVNPDQLSDSLDRLRSRASARKKPPAKPPGRILALLGARGGAGATTLVGSSRLLSGPAVRQEDPDSRRTPAPGPCIAVSGRRPCQLPFL
jgi:pilus assembly protein CpaE